MGGRFACPAGRCRHPDAVPLADLTGRILTHGDLALADRWSTDDFVDRTIDPLVTPDRQ